MLCFVFYSVVCTVVLPNGTNVLAKKSNAPQTLSMLVCLDAKLIIHPMYHDNTDVEKCPIGDD